MNKIEKKFSVNMTCASCAASIEKSLKKQGIPSQSNVALKLVKVEYDEDKYTTEDIVKMIKEVGYEAKEK